MLSGYIACLKTTLSYLIAPAFGLAHISTSVLGPFKPLRKAPDFFLLRDRRYEIAEKIAVTYLKNNVSIVLDGTYALRRWRNNIYKLGYKYGTEDVIAIKCICSNRDALKKRLAYRQKYIGVPDAQANTINAFEQSKEEFESISNDKLPDGKNISLIKFDSGTFKVEIKESNSKYANNIAGEIKNFMKHGRLNESIFIIKRFSCE